MRGSVLQLGAGSALWCPGCAVRSLGSSGCAFNPCSKLQLIGQEMQSLAPRCWGLTAPHREWRLRDSTWHMEAGHGLVGSSQAPCASNGTETERRGKEGRRRKGKESLDCLLLLPRPQGLQAPPLTKQKSNKITETGKEHLPNKLPEQEQEARGAARSPTCNLHGSARSPRGAPAWPRGQPSQELPTKRARSKETKGRCVEGDTPRTGVTHPPLSPSAPSVGKALNCNNNNKLIILPPPIALFI